ncbi:small integral membrane protein 30 [Genypterus blacodes]|uniref:small integral membrane protein 30 n=1 Tax=Genypterus blacodes TaxID=154954 RepID=UPI003F75BDDF
MHNMAPERQLPHAVTALCLVFLSLIPPAEAYDAGDALALVLGTVVTVVGFCACMGWYARGRDGRL